VLTHRLYKRLMVELEKRPWTSEIFNVSATTMLGSKDIRRQLKNWKAGNRLNLSSKSRTISNMLDFFLRDLGQCLVEVEERGVPIDHERLQVIVETVKVDVEELRQKTVELLQTIRGIDGELLFPDAKFINMCSSKQLQVMLFGGTPNKKDEDLAVDFMWDAPIPQDMRVGSKKTFELKGFELSPGDKMNDFTQTGLPSTSSEKIREVLGKGTDGSVAKQMRSKGFKEEDIEKSVQALRCMSEMKQIHHRMTGFAVPLMDWASSRGRIHPSWAFDTATGRLACRTPNLQNLPSAEQDRYKVREAFRPRDGAVFIVADYAQLELLILAHMANCPVMIEKLKKGGDYHSEVAVSMFPDIRQAVHNGEVVVERDAARPHLPTVKEKYSVERSSVKALNFGIVYGKTARSLSEDLDISFDDAQELVQKWFNSKPAVRKWLQDIRKQCIRDEKVVSLLGRWRNLPLANNRDFQTCPGVQGRSERAAMNFGVQGSAADVVMMAMLRLWKDASLKSLGFNIVMQVHDEFVLEGPIGRAEEARRIVTDIMENPFKECSPDFKFKVPMRVDASVKVSLGAT